MGSYLQQYGISDVRRGRIIKWIIICSIAVLVILWAAYLIFHNYPEKRVVERFLHAVNAGDYRAAYRDWGCTTQHPCPNYGYDRFLQDWGPSQNITPPWKIASLDGCKSFVTVNVQAKGSELQSLAVERRDYSLSFAPAPECQEKQWRWKQFFQRLFGHGSNAG